MWNRPVEMNYKLWTAFAAGLFLLAGSVNWIGVAKSGSYWEEWYSFFFDNYPNTGAFIFYLTMQGLILAVPSLVLGWIAQAVVVVLVSGVRGREARR